MLKRKKVVLCFFLFPLWISQLKKHTAIAPADVTPAPSTPAAPSPVPAARQDDEAGEDGGPKILSKKEKEKLKKEREKV